MEAPRPPTAFVGTLYVGTDRLGRALTNPEKNDLSSLLRKHDFVGASMVSLRFAYKLRRSKPAAQDLQGRAQLRLVTRGWDWKVIALVKCLCRFVWSEHTHEKRESAATRRAEETFLTEQGIHSGTTAGSPEDFAVRLEEERAADTRSAARLEALRAAFTEAKDTVNLDWVKYRLEGDTDLEVMAKKCGRDVTELHAAQKRRKRLAIRLAADLPGGAGGKDEEDT